MSNRILGLSTAAAIIAAGPAAASAQTIAYGTSSPVAITGSSIIDSTSILGWDSGDFALPARFVTNDVTLTFVNKSDRPIVLVKFTLDDGTQSVQDKGLFSPGVPIVHSFTLRGRTSTDANATSRVEEVDFADGSVWHLASGDADGR